jgi:hypothetical protein
MLLSLLLPLPSLVQELLLCGLQLGMISAR